MPPLPLVGGVAVSIALSVPAPWRSVAPPLAKIEDVGAPPIWLAAPLTVVTPPVTVRLPVKFAPSRVRLPPWIRNAPPAAV